MPEELLPLSKQSGLSLNTARCRTVLPVTGENYWHHNLIWRQSMLAAILLLTLVSAAVELYLCHKVPFLGTICKSSPLTGLAFSIILSVMLGKAFGATGMITLVAGLTSTLITGVVYKIQSWMDVRKTPSYALAKQRKATAKARLANIKQLNKPKRTPAHQHKPSAKMVMAC